MSRRIVGRDPRNARTLAVTLHGRMIERVEEIDEPTDLYLSPGLIDLQVNGYRGFDLNAEAVSMRDIHGLCEALLAEGVTSFAPTLITASEERLCHALHVIAETRRESTLVADCIPFVHMEGPFLSPLDGYRGAHPTEFVRPASLREFERWQEVSGGLVGMITLSPHTPESLEVISELVQHKVHVALGHTHASTEQVRRAVDVGARLATHVGNGLPPLLPRHPNPIWSQLAEDRLIATFIADGHHLPPETLKVMLHAKGWERSILVSDAVALAGMSPGCYTTPVGGDVELHADGRLTLAGADLLAGATWPLRKAVSEVIRATDCPLGQALMLVTANPGRFLRQGGTLEVGARADLMRFRYEDEMLVEDVWLAGEQVYSRSAACGTLALPTVAEDRA